MTSGMEIDRYSSKFKKFLSPRGTPLDMRSLPPPNIGKLNIFMVMSPFEVQSFTIAPTFGKIGLAKQYLSPVNMKFGEVLKILICVLNIFILFWLWLISPYKYNWDENLRQPNENAIVVIRLITIIICFVSIFFLIRSKRNKRYLNFFFFLNLIFSSGLLIQTFFV